MNTDEYCQYLTRLDAGIPDPSSLLLVYERPRFRIPLKSIYPQLFKALPNLTDASV